MSGAHSRRKGARWERELVQLFREAMPGADIKRGLQSRSGEEVADVDLPVFWVEAKHHHKTNVQAALKQAGDTAPQGRIPIAVCKSDRQPPLVAMYIDDFMEFIKEWWEGCNR